MDHHAEERNIRQARAFLKRALEAPLYESRLLSLYDAFVCLFGPFQSMQKLSDSTGIGFSRLKDAIESCRNDSDQPHVKVKLDAAEMQLLVQTLNSLIS